MKRSELTPEFVRDLIAEVEPIVPRIAEIEGAGLRHPNERIGFCAVKAAEAAKDVRRYLAALVTALEDDAKQ